MSELAAALVAAAEELVAVSKGRTADTGKFSYSYANIDDVISATRPVLAAHGIVALQSLHELDSGPAVTTVLLHSSGERMDFGPLPFRHGATPQDTGSAVTYFRRYSLIAALGLATGDDDGAQASRPVAQATAPPNGLTSAELLDEIKRKLAAEKLEDDDGEMAKAIWKLAGPKAVNGRITEGERERVLAVADEYIGHLPAADGSPPAPSGDEPF